MLAIAKHPAGRSVSGGPGGAWPVEEIPSATFYFRFYLARALEAVNATENYVDLLQPWRTMLAEGLTTWAEHPEPSRSDCHAWSAHPALDLLRVVAGIRPGSIVVLHEGSAQRRGVVETTDELLTALGDQGLAAVTVSQLVALRR